MTLKRTEQLIQILRAHGVGHFKTHDIEVRFGAPPLSPTTPATVSPAPSIVPRGTTQTTATNVGDVKPAHVDVPHHVNQIVSVLKMSDEQLLDTVFPLPDEDQQKAAE